MHNLAPKLAYASIYDPRDCRGFGFYTQPIIPLLENQFSQIRYLHQFRSPVTYPTIALKAVFYRKLLKKYYSARRDSRFVKAVGRQLTQKLAGLDADVVFSSVSPGSQPIAYADTPKPMVFWTDSTFAGTLDYYPTFDRQRMCQETYNDGLANERAALERCSLAVYYSDWAAQSAIDHHHVDPIKVKVVPPGGNIEPNLTLEEIKTIINRRPSDRCKLLFLGADWHRKGGDIALEVAQALNTSGLPTELVMVGGTPPSDLSLPSYVQALGMLSRSSPEEFQQLTQLLSESHFLILPSRAECFGLVFCEASAFGLPSLATRTGGIPTAVQDDINGKTFALDASVEEYCAYISDLFTDYERYKALALSAFHQYQTRLNWGVAIQTLKQLMMELV